MATTTNYGWTTPDNTALVKDGASAIRTLGSSVDTTVKALSPGTTAGDLDYYTSSTAKSRIGIGTTGQVLTVSGGVPAWATASAGGITLISETTASALTSLSFSSIPSTYKSLLLVWHGITQSDASTGFSVRINNDSGSNYANTRNYFNGSSFGVDNSQDTIVGNSGDISPFGRSVSAGETDYSAQPHGFINIDNYASTSKFKFYNAFWGWYAPYGTRFMSLVGTYKSTSAVSSVDIIRWTGTGTFSNAANTSIRLYGLS
jgi:hypothetical protein